VEINSTVFSYTGSVASYTIPTTGLYTIEALGAQGGFTAGGNGGYGAEAEGTFQFAAGTVLDIVVGGGGG
jgi:hypothetical protein